MRDEAIKAFDASLEGVPIQKGMSPERRTILVPLSYEVREQIFKPERVQMVIEDPLWWLNGWAVKIIDQRGGEQQLLSDGRCLVRKFGQYWVDYDFSQAEGPCILQLA
jgi:hypothetical protein